MPRENLVLYLPHALTVALDGDPLARQLQDFGFLGDPWSAKRHRLSCSLEKYYRVGPRFLNLIKFRQRQRAVAGEETELGDAPMDEGVWLTSKFIGLEARDEFGFQINTLTVAPVCPSCQHEVQEWPDLLLKHYEYRTAVLWLCPRCNIETPVHELDWRQRTAFGRFFINIYDVRFNEASPAPALLSFLQEKTNTSWAFAFLRA